MESLLTLVFIGGHRQLELMKDEIPPEVEYILLDSNKITDLNKINYCISMANGMYISILKPDDIMLSDFIPEVINGIGSNRDVVLFDTIDTEGVIYSYTSLPKRYNLTSEEPVLPLQYFHAVKRRIVLNTRFYEDKDRDPYGFYSKKVTNMSFNEYNIRKPILKHDNI